MILYISFLFERALTNQRIWNSLKKLLTNSKRFVNIIKLSVDSKGEP